MTRSGHCKGHEGGLKSRTQTVTEKGVNKVDRQMLTLKQKQVFHKVANVCTQHWWFCPVSKKGAGAPSVQVDCSSLPTQQGSQVLSRMQQRLKLVVTRPHRDEHHTVNLAGLFGACIMWTVRKNIVSSVRLFVTEQQKEGMCEYGRLFWFQCSSIYINDQIMYVAFHITVTCLWFQKTNCLIDEGHSLKVPG